jgi:lipoyl(octanoyl) transferase
MRIQWQRYNGSWLSCKRNDPVTTLRSPEIYHDTVPRSAAVNMALDELLWLSATAPRLRLYRWDRSAISFGYFGRYSDVAGHRVEYDLVRRCTGGGVVFHGKDLTYALIIPAQTVGYESPMSVYAFVHQAIKNALTDVGISAMVAEDGDCRRFALRKADGGLVDDVEGVGQSATSTTACFANPVVADVLVEGAKVAGAAQRRSRRGLLQQGSIQNVMLPHAFEDKFICALCAKPITKQLPTGLVAEAEKLAGAKYASKEWLQRR